MKVYNLCCPDGHRFEGWFASEEDYLAQSDRKLLACPVCEHTDIKRLPSAPRLNLTSNSGSVEQAAPSGTPPAALEGLLQQWQALTRKILAETEDVGESFADEARKIHYQESPERGIRGIATADQQAELHEEGIEVFSLPIPVPPKQSIH